MVRLTWQIDPKNKFSTYHDRYPKFKGHELIGGASPSGTRGGPARSDHALYYTGQAKWTSRVSNRLLLEGGYSTNVESSLDRLSARGAKGARHAGVVQRPSGRTTCSRCERLTAVITPANGIDPKA